MLQHVSRNKVKKLKEKQHISKKYLQKFKREN